MKQHFDIETCGALQSSALMQVKPLTK